jgi:dTMP kinase
MTSAGPSTGTLLAIEGIDGVGKRTQAALLNRALQALSISCVNFSFPRYESFFGQLVGRFLNGDFGALDAVDPHFSALLYAGNRLEAKPGLHAALSAGQTILADRYIASNLAHQTARMPAAQQPEFLQWLRQLEYGVYGLPAEDLVIFLRLAPTEAQRMVGRKAAASRTYTGLKHDIQESDLTHLEKAALVYDQLAAEPNWVTIECATSAGGVKPAEEIHAAVFAAVKARVLTRTVAR